LYKGPKLKFTRNAGNNSKWKISKNAGKVQNIEKLNF